MSASCWRMTKNHIILQGRRSAESSEDAEKTEIPTISLFQDELDDEDFMFHTNLDEMEGQPYLMRIVIATKKFNIYLSYKTFHYISLILHTMGHESIH